MCGALEGAEDPPQNSSVRAGDVHPTEGATYVGEARPLCSWVSQTAVAGATQVRG